MSSPLGLILPSEGLLLKEDFVSNDAVADATIGALRWELVAIGTVSTLAFQTAKPYGVLRATTTSAVSPPHGAVLRTFEDGLVLKPGFEFGARVRAPVALATSNFRIGLDDSVTVTRPTVGVTVEGAAGVLTCNVDSADHGDNSKAVSGHPDLTSGTTMVVGENLDILIKGSGKANAQGGPAEVDFYLGSVSGDGPSRLRHVAKLPCNIDDDEEVELKIAHWTDTASTAVAMEFDYVYFWQPRV